MQYRYGDYVLYHGEIYRFIIEQPNFKALIQNDNSDIFAFLAAAGYRCVVDRSELYSIWSLVMER